MTVLAEVYLYLLAGVVFACFFLRPHSVRDVLTLAAVWPVLFCAAVFLTIGSLFDVRRDDE